MPRRSPRRFAWRRISHVDRLPLATIVPAPPADGSEITKAEFAELHRIQDARTPEQVKAAQADDAEEDIFIYKTVLGAGFNAQALPLTAALSAHVHGDEPVASESAEGASSSGRGLTRSTRRFTRCAR